MIVAEPYRQVDASAWDALVRSARARHFMFERAYMDYHADRFIDASRMIVDRGRPLAAFPASRHGTEVISHGGLTFGGLLSGPELTATRAREALDALVAQLRGEGVHRLVYKAVPHIYHLGAADEDLAALHARGARLSRRDVSVAVAPGAQVRVSTERRRALARARESEVIVSEESQVDDFMALLREVLGERHDTAPVHTTAEMSLLAGRFPESIRLFAARAAGELIAGVLVYETPAVAHAQYIAASTRGRELGGNDAVFAHLLGEVFHDRWVDFGISNERDGSLNTGLLRNKEGFGARTVLYDTYELDLA